jgi:hypothetical protein
LTSLADFVWADNSLLISQLFVCEQAIFLLSVPSREADATGTHQIDASALAGRVGVRPGGPATPEIDPPETIRLTLELSGGLGGNHSLRSVSQSLSEAPRAIEIRRSTVVHSKFRSFCIELSLAFSQFRQSPTLQYLLGL